MPGIASAATSVVIAHVAGGTRTIRVGAGGIMLPNHAPLVIAEQFGTLESLYPGRIDLGLGRAPGTDQVTLRALRRDAPSADIVPAGRARAAGAARRRCSRARPCRRCPAPGSRCRSGSSARASTARSSRPRSGLPYAFASHFAPDALLPALEVYRARFQPSAQLEQPYAMVGVNVVAADDDARRGASSRRCSRRSRTCSAARRGQLPAADRRHRGVLDARGEGARVAHARRSFVGSPETVRAGSSASSSETGADELIVAAAIYDHAARLRSYEILAGLRPALRSVLPA